MRARIDEIYELIYYKHSISFNYLQNLNAKAESVLSTINKLFQHLIKKIEFRIQISW